MFTHFIKIINSLHALEKNTNSKKVSEKLHYLLNEE